MMKKITEDARDAFYEGRSFNRSNTQVEVLPNVTILRLFGNAIAYRYNDPEKTLSICTCGWNTNTTKERLNSLFEVSIYQKNHIWYLNGKEWDGSLIDIS